MNARNWLNTDFDNGDNGYICTCILVASATWLKLSKK